jgi:hypothetical protein
VNFSIAAALLLACAQPAFACSGYPTLYYQHVADVVVSGKVTTSPTLNQQVVVPRRVLKGAELPAYSIAWPVASLDDECAFLYPVARERGVFFLKRRTDGAYDVLQTEKRWKMVP